MRGEGVRRTHDHSLPCLYTCPHTFFSQELSLRKFQVTDFSVYCIPGTLILARMRHN